MLASEQGPDKTLPSLLLDFGSWAAHSCFFSFIFLQVVAFGSTCGRAKIQSLKNPGPA